jgi:hypothetical protein
LGIAVGGKNVKVNGKAAGNFTPQELRDQMRNDDSLKTVELLIKNLSGEKSFTIKKEYIFS